MRKYFRRVLREAEEFRVDTSPGVHWAGWHRHVDWSGWGNRSWKLRREHLRALAIMFRHVHDSRELIQVPFHAWIGLNADDSGCDGLFLESAAAANGARWRPDVLEWEDGAAVPQVAELLPGIRLRVGLARWVDGDEDGVATTVTTYFIYSPDVGLPLE